MVQRFGMAGPECLLVAGGGGGGASRGGVGGSGIDGELDGERVDKRNGRVGTAERGGEGGDSGEVGPWWGVMVCHGVSWCVMGRRLGRGRWSVVCRVARARVAHRAERSG